MLLILLPRTTLQNLNLIQGSVSTLPGGKSSHHYSAAAAGRAKVSWSSWIGYRPSAPTLRHVLDLGWGIIADYLVGRFATRTALDGAADARKGHWHVIEGDRDFIRFPYRNMGNKIRTLASQGELKAKVECDGRRYKGLFPHVTALLRSQEGTLDSCPCL